MKGKRDPKCDWPAELGLAILQARTPLYERFSHLTGLTDPRFWRSHQAIGAFMGLSYVAVQHIERRALRKLRIKLLYGTDEFSAELREAFKEYSENGTASRTVS